MAADHPLTPEERPELEERHAWQQARAEHARAAGARMFMGLPDRWYDPPGSKFRCPNGHISLMVLKSEARGGDLCLACLQFVILTHPEDTEGAALPES